MHKAGPEVTCWSPVHPPLEVHFDGSGKRTGDNDCSPVGQKGSHMLPVSLDRSVCTPLDGVYTLHIEDSPWKEDLLHSLSLQEHEWAPETKNVC